MERAILWPTLALVALIWIVWFRLFYERTRLMRSNPPKPEDFADGASAQRYFAPAEMPSNNFKNLFELPVLYFALVPLLMLTGLATPVQLGLAWAFVLSRAAHSFIQIFVKRVPLRFLVYLFGAVMLLAMWIGFAIDLVANA